MLRFQCGETMTGAGRGSAMPDAALVTKSRSSNCTRTFPGDAVKRLSLIEQQIGDALAFVHHFILVTIQKQERYCHR